MWRIVLAITVALALLHAESSFATAGTFYGVQHSRCAGSGNGDNVCSVGEFITQQAAWSPTWSWFIPGTVGCHAGSANLENMLSTWIGENANVFIYDGRLDCAETSGAVSSTAVAIWRCADGTFTQSRTSCPTYSCRRFEVVSLSVPLSSANPPAAEFSPVCYQGCEANIAEARIMREATPVETYYMVGTYSLSGVTCDASTRSTTPEMVGDPTQGGDQAEVTGVAEDTCPKLDLDCHTQKWRESIGAEYKTFPREDNALANAQTGPVLEFPLVSLFTGGVERVCSVDVTLPGGDAFALVRAMVGGDQYKIDFCAYLADIDRIGGWLLYAFTAFVLFEMWMRPVELR